MFQIIRKRNNVEVPFDSEKITEAIAKALHAVGDTSLEKAKEITSRVIERMKEMHGSKKTVTVEEVQDAVEFVLINEGHAKVAKAYILYRRRRAEIRNEKKQILGKVDIDEVDKQFDVNALRVLASRYLRKDDDGKIIESPKELFTRVSVHTTLPSLFYDSRVTHIKESPVKNFKEVVWNATDKNKKLSIGKYELNQFHKDAFLKLYNLFARNGRTKMTFAQLCSAVRKGEFDSYEKEITEYFDAMVARRFMPNTPALANFGNFLGMGSACFVLGIDDAIESIMDTLKSASIIFKSGGGVGYNFSNLRPEGDFVKTTGGVASGPLSFMRMFDTMTEVIKQGGIRRGANMGIINSNHPDILKFIKAKEGNKGLRNFNISVLITEDFWPCYEKKKPYPLVSPRTKKIVGYIDPQQLFTMLVYQAWESAEPGVIFADHANEFNPFLKYLGPIVTTNPCGEVLLYPYESCNLGSINIWNLVTKDASNKKVLDWDGLARAVSMATRFLDNVTDVNLYPLPEIEKMTHFTRKIGLGIMGVGDALYELGLPYNSKEGIAFMEQLMEFVNYHSKVTSIELAKKRGILPAYNQSFYKDGMLPVSGFKDKKSWHFDWDNLSKDVKKYGIRNGYTTVVAPTGSISMIAGCSSGIEPVYSLVFEKHVSVGSFYYVDPVFEDVMQREGLMGDDLIKDVAAHKGSVAQLPYIPTRMKKTFVTAHDITPRDHIYALAAFQKWVDSSISKTNNFPADATVEDVREVYLLAYKLGCKDVTVYRDGSIMSQVLVSGTADDKKKETKKVEKPAEPDLIPLKDEKAKGMGVYKDAAVYGGADSLDLSPASADLASYKEETKEHGDDIEINGAVKCKLCNL